MMKLGKFAAVMLGTLLAGSMTIGLAGCNGDAPEGSTEISFWYSASLTNNRIYRELINTYNEGQGQEDGVWVEGDNRQNVDSTQLYVNPPEALVVSDEDFKSYALDDLLLDMTSYYEEMPGDYNEADIPDGATEAFRFDTADNAEGKRMAGEGAAIQGVPFGISVQAYYYSKTAFEAYGINIISVSEEELNGSGTYAKVQPHGYAEYKDAPFDGAVSSTNLAGETVYKVFNNRIPMNWEEFRYLSKCFTKSFRADSPTTYGSATHHWFSFGWSVGGDCIGYDGEKYAFTVADQTPNYLVTHPDGVTVNGTQYAAGEIVTYEDKVNTENIAEMDGLYELPSQYDAIAEFDRLTTPTDREVDEGIPGYGISYAPDDGAANNLTIGEYAMFAWDMGAITTLESTNQGNYDIAPLTQYREYEGGSTYQKDGADGFANEYLKVIGVDYGDGVYTGELAASEEGTPLTGVRAACASYSALVIPRNSDAEKHEAAWKFIRWAAGPEGQAILMQTNTIVPNQTELAMSESFLSFGEGKNYYALADSSQYSDIGDWAYFEDGEWVTAWSGYFNNQLRTGYMTITEFLNRTESVANNTIGAVNIVLNGRR